MYFLLPDFHPSNSFSQVVLPFIPSKSRSDTERQHRLRIVCCALSRCTLATSAPPPSSPSARA
ncbi:unnamed protein product, partial [Tilletia laevis]